MRSNRLYMGAAVAALALVSMSGCASTTGAGAGDRTELAANLLVQGATLAYIKQVPPQDRPARAGRIQNAVEAVLEVAKDGDITLQRLAQLAAEQIPATADPAERLLAMNLIQLAQDALQGNIGVGGLESDTLLRLSRVLAQVSLVASLYVAPD